MPSVAPQTSPTPTFARAIVEPVRVDAPVESVIATFCAGQAPAILETTLPAVGGKGYSIFACNPIAEFIHPADDPRCPFQTFAAYASRYPRLDSGPSELPYFGGWIGYFTYEAGLSVERLTTRKSDQRLLPAAHWYLYDALAILDHADRSWYAAAIDWPQSPQFPREPIQTKLTRVINRLKSAESARPKAITSAPSARVTTVSFNRHSPIANRQSAPSSYDHAFARAAAYITAGDIYQVNLTQRYTIDNAATPLEIYLNLRGVSPSPYAAFLPWSEGAIISSSPELFLNLRNGHVMTRPIKGTRPRGKGAESDANLRAELESSEKDRAELNMIIDLLRNDLGRVSRFGSVRVTDTGSIETHPTVFHRVAAVEGDLVKGAQWPDLLRATFPGGSVTGCPKIRAMQIIDELEPHAREVYCGAIGFIGLDGALTLNLAIRTMLQRGTKVYAYAGGAIVADSTADGEYREIETKVAGMLKSLGVIDGQGLVRLP